MTEALHSILFLLILVFGLGMLAGKLSAALKLPDVALYLALGMALGPGLHLIHVESGSMTNQLILTLGSTIILFDGGRNIRLSGLGKVWISVSLLSVPGVLITCAAVAAAAHWLLQLPWLYAALLGSIIASTDPATLIPVFKQVRIRTKVRETVESESAFNDATGSILTFSVLGLVVGGGTFSLGSGVADFARTALGGVAVGCVIGFALTYATAHLKLGFLRDYATIAMVVTALGAYLAGDWLHVSGFMATFVAGLIWGNAETFKMNMNDQLQEMGHFTDNVTVLMRMLIFILLGSQVQLGVIGAHFWASVGVIAVFMLIARPLTVFLCAGPDRRAGWTWRELLFMCWVRETGVIPAALAV
ncbi:cation:proton antiporter [Gordoniibacillus kamchatkensis]|uniref:cation:proton antiporter n=1 Tax=Gordoniibacillus kamchatkensis TaxID=1590651 RepID=UPI000B011EA6